LSTEREIVASGKKAQILVDALNAISFKILRLTYKEPLSISTLAKKLDVTEPHISGNVKTLENLKLINIKYERGERGIRKIVSSNLERVIISFKDEVVE
jgi:predicted transcriptional regulator